MTTRLVIILLAVASILASGCATPDVAKAQEEAYAEGLQEGMQYVIDKIKAGETFDKHFGTFDAPVFQTVRRREGEQGGVYYKEGHVPVLINPGAEARSAKYRYKIVNGKVVRDEE